MAQSEEPPLAVSLSDAELLYELSSRTAGFFHAPRPAVPFRERARRVNERLRRGVRMSMLDVPPWRGFAVCFGPARLPEQVFRFRYKELIDSPQRLAQYERWRTASRYGS